MRELHGHHMQFFAFPVESLKLGHWSALDRIATIEEEWNRYEEARVNEMSPDLPVTAEECRDWFEATAEVHEHHDACDYLQNEASLLDIALLVLAEGKVESYFDDPMTIARDHWDEMGNGKHDAAHTVMLDSTTEWMRENAIAPGFDLGIVEIPKAYANA